MKRTEDKAYLPCPICGKPPKINYWYPPNSGTAHCDGRIFKRHTRIEAVVEYEQPSKLVKTLVTKWTDVINDYECANLPVW